MAFLGSEPPIQSWPPAFGMSKNPPDWNPCRELAHARAGHGSRSEPSTPWQKYGILAMLINHDVVSVGSQVIISRAMSLAASLSPHKPASMRMAQPACHL